MLVGILQRNSTTAVTYTLPTGSVIYAGVFGGALPINQVFDWSVVNVGTSTCTLAVSSNHITLGNLVIDAGTSGIFTTNLGSTTAATTYRVSYMIHDFKLMNSQSFEKQWN